MLAGAVTCRFGGCESIVKAVMAISSAVASDTARAATAQSPSLSLPKDVVAPQAVQAVESAASGNVGCFREGSPRPRPLPSPGSAGTGSSRSAQPSGCRRCLAEPANSQNGGKLSEQRQVARQCLADPSNTQNGGKLSGQLHNRISWAPTDTHHPFEFRASFQVFKVAPSMRAVASTFPE